MLVQEMDNLSPAQRKKTMKRVKSKDTSPELAVRRLLYGMGYRYRINFAALPGKPDVVFIGRRKVVLVHVCFWHGHTCKAGCKSPKTNPDYWSQKLANNKLRDAKSLELLAANGWRVLIVWECQAKDKAALHSLLHAFMEDQ